MNCKKHNLPLTTDMFGLDSLCDECERILDLETTVIGLQKRVSELEARMRYYLGIDLKKSG